MKNSKTCPGYVGSGGAGTNITVGWTIFSNVRVWRYVCCRCGFVEHWVDGSADIARVEKKYRKRAP